MVLNAESYIERTLDSVLHQNYERIEHVVIDGGSRDRTLDILHRHSARVKWISEPDAGIYDAFNKGLNLASGNYIAFLNAGDWIEPGHIEIAVAALEDNPASAFVFGDVIYYDREKPVFASKGSNDYYKTFRHNMGHLNHPSMVVRRSLFEAVGPFEISYRVAGDFNWLQRVHRSGYRGTYTNRILTHMALGGISDHQRLQALKENRISSIAVGMNPAICWTMYMVFIVRYSIRRAMECVLPQFAITFIRQRILRSNSMFISRLALLMFDPNLLLNYLEEATRANLPAELLRLGNATRYHL